MLNDKKIFIYNLCFGLPKLYTNIQQHQKEKLDYQMSICLRIQRAGRVGVRGFKMFCQRGSELFLLALCVCGGGGSGSVLLLP